MSMPPPNIIYFTIRGRAEVIRLIFEELGVAYDEQRLNSAQELNAMKPLTPFGALPIYEEGDLKFAQTQAIFRHIARTRGLYGRVNANTSSATSGPRRSTKQSFAFRFLDEVDALFPAVLAAHPGLKAFHAAFEARPGSPCTSRRADDRPCSASASMGSNSIHASRGPSDRVDPHRSHTGDPGAAAAPGSGAR